MQRRVVRRVWAAVGAAALVVSISACAPGVIEPGGPNQVEAPIAGDTVAQMEDAVEAARIATGSTGAIVGVWAPWSGEWVAAIGTDAAGTPLTPDMAVRSGPLTRLMTCDLLDLVAADGRIDPDSPVADNVAGVPELTDVTLRQLCDGTSGLEPSGALVAQQAAANPARQWHPLEVSAYALAGQRGAAGAAYDGSDVGYMLLGLALEQATNTSVADLYDRYIFGPLGLQNTELPSPPSAAPAGAAGYMPGYLPTRLEDGAFDCTNPVDVSEMSASFGNAESGVTSTIPELGRYLRALGSGALARDDAVAAARFADAAPAYDGAPAWYNASGGALLAGSLIGNGGETRGYLTAGFTDPATGLTVVVALNGGQGTSAGAIYLAWQLAAIASKAPAAAGNTAPEFGLPWEAEAYGEAIATRAIACQ